MDEKDKIVKDGGETTVCRPNLLKFCGDMGVDLGFGGDPIKPEAITVDLPEPYAKVGPHKQNLKGDATNLYWFNEGVLDYVFSSHLLEDFSREEIPGILQEWLRVLKPGGNIVLYMPDQQRYLKYCENNKWGINLAHKDPDMSLNVMIELINQIPNTEIIHQADNCGDYSFELVIKKL